MDITKNSEEAMLPERASARPATMALGLCVILLSAVGTIRSVCAQEAGRILKVTGVQGGLIVHLGCGDGRLTAALRPNDSYIVHGLDADAANIAQARAHIRSLGLYGKVSVERWTGNRLPYADNLVNLLVSANLGKIPMREVMRVLAPHGVAYVNQRGRWRKTVKPRPKNIDEWTHYLHDASGNAVAHDQVVGPPRYVQWIGEPRHSRSHEYTPSIFALVSTGGRIFYVADQAPIAAIRRPAEWHLVARDAFNGILLWQRPIPTWFSHLCGWTQGPMQLQRKVVAVGNRVYVTLGYHAPLSALDAVTGEVVKVYEQTDGTEEIVCHKGILLLVVRSVTDERIAEFAKWTQLTEQKESPLHARAPRDPLVKQFRAVERKAKIAILALDADTGRLLWKKPDWLRSMSLCAVGDRVFYQKGKNVICLDLKTGQQVWSTRSSRLRVVCDSSVICASNRTITALSADTGETVWTQDSLLTGGLRDAFVINGSLWMGGFKPYDTGKKHTGAAWGPYFATQRDLATGKVLKHIEPVNPGHHHRCFINKATDRYILGGRRGTEFIDLQSGDVLWNSWVRGVCRYGVMPCNGLFYAPPHACACYIAAKLTGFYALASETAPGPTVGTPDEKRLERGPAYSQRTRTRRSAARNQDWPTYRCDAQRSGCTRSAVPAVLRRRWQADIGGKLTSLTVAGGKVFVASVDEHRVIAMDADSGKPVWQFAAGARVDSPPTLYEGRAIFGCRDGYVYSLRASDGALAWRLRAARAERRVMAWGQLESVSPVPGSVLVEDGVAYFTAGRSSYMDGGIDLYRIRPGTGRILSKTRIYSPDPQTGRQPEHDAPGYMPGSLEDILLCDGQYVYLRDTVFDKAGSRQEKGNPHLFTLTGFLDDTWPHRSYWMFSMQCAISSGCTWRGKNLINGRLLVLDDSMIYGYGRATVHWSSQLEDKAYRLFALKRGETKVQWTKSVAIQVRAMVLADKVLFVAGPPADADAGTLLLSREAARGVAPPADAGDGAPGRDESQGALLIAISASDGSELARCRLDSSPVFDGMAVANGRLYLAAQNGRVLCMGKK